MRWHFWMALLSSLLFLQFHAIQSIACFCSTASRWIMCMRTSPIFSSHLFIGKCQRIKYFSSQKGQRFVFCLPISLLVDGKSLSSYSLPHLTYWDLMWFFTAPSFRVIVGSLHHHTVRPTGYGTNPFYTCQGCSSSFLHSIYFIIQKFPLYLCKKASIVRKLSFGKCSAVVCWFQSVTFTSKWDGVDHLVTVS